MLALEREVSYTLTFELDERFSVCCFECHVFLVCNQWECLFLCVCVLLFDVWSSIEHLIITLLRNLVVASPSLLTR